MTDETADLQANLQILEKRIEDCDAWVSVSGVFLLTAIVSIPFSIFTGNKTLAACSFCWICASFVQAGASFATQKKLELRKLIDKANASDDDEEEGEGYYVLDAISMN